MKNTPAASRYFLGGRDVTVFFIILATCIFVMVITLSPNEPLDSLPEMHSQSRTEIANLDSKKSDFFPLERFYPEDGNCLPNYFLHGDSVPDKRAYSDGVIGFQHLNKAGGMTTRACIRDFFTGPPYKMNYLISSPQRSELEAHMAFGSVSTDDIDIFHGDYFFGVCQKLKQGKLNRSCSYFTVLRDPYDRTISSYLYCQKANLDQTCGPFRVSDLTIEEWAILQGSYFFLQLLQKYEYCKMGDPFLNEFADILSENLPQTSYFGFPHHCWYLEKIILNKTLTLDGRRKLLDYLVSNLENIFAVIGLSDDFRSTFALLEKVYKLPFKKCIKKSAKNLGPQSKNKTLYSSLKERLLRNPVVTDALKEDVALFRKGKEIFSKQMKALKSTS